MIFEVYIFIGFTIGFILGWMLSSILEGRKKIGRLILTSDEDGTYAFMELNIPMEEVKKCKLVKLDVVNKCQR